MNPGPDVTDHPERILIVDDERHNRQLLQIMLEPEGFSVDTADNGEDALAIVAQQPPDLILLDVMMPGMNGYQVAATIKGDPATRNIPVIMVTALDDRDARMHGLLVGAEDFLTKPVDRAELCVRVRNLLRLRAYGAYYDRYSQMLEGEVDSRTADLVEEKRQAAVLRAAETALEQSRKEQLRFKDEFLSHVSHELRSPLTAIKQFTSILLGGLSGELGKEQREYLEIVSKNVRQLQTMIDDLLEVTRLETGKLTVQPESVSVSEAVTDVFNTLQGTAGAKGVILSCELPLDLPSVSADPTRLRQILIILLDNAIKFTPTDGAIRISVRSMHHDPRFLIFDVCDTGCGISPEMSGRIFERLYQVSARIETSRKGLGLGLYICKELVSRQGGEIWVGPQTQKGSTFSFTLPVFSLNTSIAALLKNDRWPAKSVALVTVELRFAQAWRSTGQPQECSHETRSLLEHCVLPDLDVLLPNMSHGADGENFYIAAFADENGALVLVSRIRQQLSRLLCLKQRGVSVSVSHSMMEALSPELGEATDDVVTRMAARLEESIKSPTAPGAYLS